jgi:hypothetical protein
MNDYIRFPGGTVVVGVHDIDFDQVYGPAVVITGGQQAANYGSILGEYGNLTHLYMGDLMPADFIYLLPLKMYIKVPQLWGKVPRNQLDSFVDSLLNTKCKFAVTVALGADLLSIFVRLEGQSNVRFYPIGHERERTVLITNDPMENLSTWNPFVLYETRETIIFSEKVMYFNYRHEQDLVCDLVVHPNSLVNRGPLSLPPSRELHFYNRYNGGEISLEMLKRPYDRLVVHLFSEDDLRRFKVEDLHPDTKLVEIHGCSARVTADLKQRVKERSVCALFHAQGTPISKVNIHLIKLVADLL